MLQKIRSSLFKWRSMLLVRSLSNEIPRLVAVSPKLIEVVPADDWRIQRVFYSLSDVNVLVIGPDNNTISAVLYLPKTDRGIADLNRRKKVSAQLSVDERLMDWQKYFPHILGEGVFQNRPYWIMEHLPGIGLDTTLHDHDIQRFLWLAVEALSHFHQRTAREVVVKDEALDEWVFSAIRAILQSPLIFSYRKSRVILERLGVILANALRGEKVLVSWVHGDFWPNNVLISKDGKQITGIIDWDLSQPDDLPLLDIVNFLLSAGREMRGSELGEVIVETHKLGAWSDKSLQGIWDQEIQRLGCDIPSIRDLLMIFWLRHISANLLKSRKYSVNPIWINQNYRFVMKYIETYVVS